MHGCVGQRLCGHGCGAWCEGVDLFFSFFKSLKSLIGFKSKLSKKPVEF